MVLVLAFVLLSPGDDDEPEHGDDAHAPPLPRTTPASPADEPEQTTTAVTPPASAAARAGVRDASACRRGKPAGGVKTITVKNGERARIQVSSQDTSDEVHLHGYDLTRDLEAGDSVRFSFEADAEGIFEIELEGAAHADRQARRRALDG